MKKNIFRLVYVALALFVTACTNDSESNDMVDMAQLQADVEEITNTALTGPWIITNFVDSGKNETADFEGYGFSFNEDGSLVADNGSTAVTGTWSVTIDDDSDDDDNDDHSNDDSDDDNDDSNDDDSDDDDDCLSCTVEQLTDVLTGCQDWTLDKLERNTTDLEDGFSTYVFNFSADGTLTATSGSETFTGSWEASGSGNMISVVIALSGIMEIEDTWTLHEIELENGETEVDLRINGEDRLRFENNCTIGDFDGGQSTGEIDFNIFFASPEDFNELSDDWNIVSYSATKIELIDESGDGETDLLTFEKQ